MTLKGRNESLKCRVNVQITSLMVALKNHNAITVTLQCYYLVAKVKTHHSLEIVKSSVVLNSVFQDKLLRHLITNAPITSDTWQINFTVWDAEQRGEKINLSWFCLRCYLYSSFNRIMPPSFSLQLWKVAMTARTQRGYCTTWGLKSWCVWHRTNHHTALNGCYVTVYILAGGSHQKGLHAGWDRGGGAAGGWGWRGGALCVSTQCWS